VIDSLKLCGSAKRHAMPGLQLRLSHAPNLPREEIHPACRWPIPAGAAKPARLKKREVRPPTLEEKWLRARGSDHRLHQRPRAAGVAAAGIAGPSRSREPCFRSPSGSLSGAPQAQH